MFYGRAKCRSGTWNGALGSREDSHTTSSARSERAEYDQ